LTPARARVLVLAACLLACVPTSKAPPPAGAAGFQVEPSAAARGEPFESDGWTLTVEKLVIRAVVGIPLIARTDDPSLPDQGRPPPSAPRTGGAEEYIFDASRRAEIFVSGVSVGQNDVVSSMARRLTLDALPVVTLPGVVPTDMKRLGEPAEQSPYVPTVLLVIRARRGASSILLDVALDTAEVVATMVVLPVEVRANELALATLDVRPELLFRGVEGINVGFEVIASADTDHDEIVSAAELRALPLPASVFEKQPWLDAGTTLLDLLVHGLARVILGSAHLDALAAARAKEWAAGER
jgi:hypothetical protein